MRNIRTRRPSALLAALAPLALATGLACATGTGARAAGDVGFVTTEQAGEMSHSSLIGLKIKNPAGQVVGDINYLVFDAKGQITTVVVGVGGVLGLAEKNVGVPFSRITLKVEGNRNLTAALDTTVEALRAAPPYVWTEKSTAEIVKEKAKDWSEKAQEKAKDWSEKAQEKAKELSDKAKDKMATDKP